MRSCDHTTTWIMNEPQGTNIPGWDKHNYIMFKLLNNHSPGTHRGTWCKAFQHSITDNWQLQKGMSTPQMNSHNQNFNIILIHDKKLFTLTLTEIGADKYGALTISSNIFCFSHDMLHTCWYVLYRYVVNAAKSDSLSGSLTGWLKIKCSINIFITTIWFTLWVTLYQHLMHLLTHDNVFVYESVHLTLVLQSEGTTRV